MSLQLKFFVIPIRGLDQAEDEINRFFKIRSGCKFPAGVCLTRGKLILVHGCRIPG